MTFGALVAGIVMLLIGAYLARPTNWALSLVSVVLLIAGASVVMTTSPVAIPAEGKLFVLVTVFTVWGLRLLRREDNVSKLIGFLAAVIAFFAYSSILADTPITDWGIIDKFMDASRSILASAQQGYEAWRN